jgi:DNA polymerase-1
MTPDIHRFDRIAIDTETTGLHFKTDRIFGISMSTPDGKDYYWDIRRDSKIVEWLKAELPRYKGTVVFFNWSFDVKFLRSHGVVVNPDHIDCAMVRAALIDEHLHDYSLDGLAKKYLGARKDNDIYEELAGIFGGRPTRNQQVKNFPDAPVEMMARYAKRDTRLTLDLWDWQQKEINDQDLHMVCKLERDLFPVLLEMEIEGIRVDTFRAEQAQSKLTKEIDKKQKELDGIAGFHVNPNPSKSIFDLFKPEQRDGKWYAIDGTELSTTPAGKPSVDADALRRMQHPAASIILDIRKMTKARDTFIGGHILSNSIEGVIYPNINQTKGDDGFGTGTGRLSYSAPALQQIPSRDVQTAQIVRPIFLPDKGQEWAYYDLDQHEFRVMAHYVNNESILKAYADNADTDFHQIVADLTGLPRSPRYAGDANAKQINLGLCFGMGQGKLAKEMGLPFTIDHFPDGREFLKPGSDAIRVFDTYHKAIPGVRDMLKRASEVARSRGHVRTLMGRHIRFPGGNFVHKAGGLIFQGTSADLNKLNMINIHNALKGTGARLLLNVHDEYNLSTPDRGVLDEVKRVIQHHPEIRVPIRTDYGVGNNWWSAAHEDA